MKKLKSVVINNVAVMHDLVPQGHVTIQVTFPISATMIARTMILFCFLGFFVREVNGITIRCVAFTLDLVRQGHVTIQLTFPIIGTMRATTMIFFLFLRFFGSGKSMA